MKKTALILILFSTMLHAQSHYNNYEKLWKEVQQLEKDNLPKSAHEKVNAIFQKAQEENNAPQLVKALMHQSKYALITDEDAQLKIVHSFEEAINTSDFPTKNILESVLAGLYWQYFQNNRWQFYNRTHTTEKVDANDFRTWDLHTIFQEIDTHYKHSLENGLLAQNTKLDAFNALLNTQEGSKNYRPSLYDFLAQNALSFYKTGESNLPQPAYKFEIENLKLLGDNKAFLSIELVSKDSTSQKLQALKIYQNLTLFHHKTQNIPALVDVSLNRIDFVKENARFNEVNSIYLQTLKDLKNLYKKHPASTEIDYRMALAYKKQAQDYKPKINELHRFDLQKALTICEDAMEHFPKSTGANKCQNLKNEIVKSVIQMTDEVNIYPNTASKVLLKYKNLDKIYFRILKSAPNIPEKIQKIYNAEKKRNYINKLQVANSFETNLMDEKDYQMHSTEIVIPELNPGFYIILASADADFNSPYYIFSFIQATKLALVESKINNAYRYQVIDRKNGNPVVGASVNLRNKNTRFNNKPIDVTLTTDSKGFIKYAAHAHHNHVEITVKHHENYGLFRYYRIYKQDNYRQNDRPFQTNTVFLFTDRSIYRPGQTVYFKGIAVDQKENISRIISNRTIQISLHDVNYQEVGTQEFVTNEYGSFSGTFILPDNGLTGHYELNVHGKPNKKFIDKFINSSRHEIFGSTGFSVEEYKRPKFAISFDKVSDSFKLNDSVSVQGKALAYAGSNITDAKVVYRVTREVRYPRWWYWYRPVFHSEAQEITHGETTTDAQGNFKINFIAQPDKSVKPEDLPVFNYKIYADITDINGETRSATSLVNVGYHSMLAQIIIEDKLDKKTKEHSIKIDTKNLNGEFVPAKGVLKIFKVPTPKNVYRKRPWEIPDYKIITAEKYQNLFPHEAYDKQDILDEKSMGKALYEIPFDTEKEKELHLKRLKNWTSGKYLIVLESQDKFGQKVTDKTHFDLYSNKDSKPADQALFTIQLDKKTYQPEDQLTLTMGSASKDISILLDIEKDHKIIESRLIHLNNEIKKIHLPITKEDFGGFALHYHFVNFNSFESGSIPVSVPYPKSDLTIETATFRDKLQPGQEETWSFKIKGPKGDKVLAEILSSMYDASLDQFKKHAWSFNPIYHKYYYSRNTSSAYKSFGTDNNSIHIQHGENIHIAYQNYDALNWFGLSLMSHRFYGRGELLMEDAAPVMAKARGANLKMAPSAEAESKVEAVVIEDDAEYADEMNESQDKEAISEKNETPDIPVKIRTNFQETAFFFPHLTTDSEGNVSFSFTTPESLTKWKLQVLAHTKTLNSGIKTLETVTQKELMLLPNPPRFLREGDRIIFSSKIANLSEKVLNGFAEIQLFDAITNKTINNQLGISNTQQNFSVDSKGNTQVSWNLQIPFDVQSVQYKIIAKAGSFSDGEQNMLPVLSNRMLVTETLPMWVRSNQTQTFKLDKLKNNKSTTLKNHRLTLEVTSNPAWYAVQALPYLMEYPYECSEQTFSRYYANTLASYIANSNPRIQEVFKQWKNSDALLSNLEKNQELKSLIIQETPWLRDAQSETEQKKRIALLFDLNKMQSEQKAALKKLDNMQMSNGGFPWFKGNHNASRYITQHIVSGMGHLEKLGVPASDGSYDVMLKKALGYLDNEILNDYQKLLKTAERIKKEARSKRKGEKLAKEFLAKNHTSHFQVHYLYARSFYKDIKIPERNTKAVTYFTQQTYKYWNDYNLYTKGLISLIAYRNQNNAIVSKVLKSIKENSVNNEELGMYWKSNTSSWYWYQAPIETQALLIEAFSEAGPVIQNDKQNTEDVDNMKIWLLKNKQTNRWKTTKATTEAVYALLLQGTHWIESTEFVGIQIGGKNINPLQLEDSKIEAGTGYYKTSWNAEAILPEMAEVTISKKDKGIAWGALYWQYFENLDKITFAKTPLQLSKKLFVKNNTDRGETLKELTDKTELHLGDLVRVRIELKVDRAMEFVHMKDMRASGFEPVNVLSQYKWQDGLGYYESTKDASTNFFIDYLPKGVYVFEYDLRANNAGDFSNGITSIQSMYAPEFSSHSEGVRVVVKE